MPVDAKNNRFMLPGPNGTMVGDRVYYINEDHSDGRPQLINALKIRAGFKGISFQDVYPHFLNGTLQGYDLTPFYSTADLARNEYVASANWRLSQKHDPNRPADVAQRQGIKANRDILMAMDWGRVVAEARENLENVLSERKWGKLPIPIQQHLIGDTITGDNGKKSQIAEVELVNQDGRPGIVMAESLRLVYFDRIRNVITTSPKIA